MPSTFSELLNVQSPVVENAPVPANEPKNGRNSSTRTFSRFLGEAKPVEAPPKKTNSFSDLLEAGGPIEIKKEEPSGVGFFRAIADDIANTAGLASFDRGLLRGSSAISSVMNDLIKAIDPVTDILDIIPSPFDLLGDPFSFRNEKAGVVRGGINYNDLLLLANMQSNALIKNLDEEIGDQTLTGALIEGLGQASAAAPVAVPAGLFAATSAGPIGGAIAGGVVAEVLGFSPDDPRLSNLSEEMLGPSILSALKADPSDPAPLKAVKQAAEALVVNMAAEGLGAAAVKLASRVVNSLTDIKAKQVGDAVGKTAMTRGEIDPNKFLSGRSLAGVEVARVREVLLNKIKPGTEKVDEATEFFEAELNRIDPTHENFSKDAKERMVDQFIKMAEVKKRVRTPTIGVAGPARIKFDAASKQAIEQEKFTAKKLARLINESFFDRSGTIRSQLLKEGGDLGQEAIERFDLSAGAPSYADKAFSRARKKIYKNFTRNDQGDFDFYIQQRRMLEIKRTNPDFVELDVDGEPISRLSNEAEIFNLNNKVGDAKFAEFEARADQYFGIMRTQLDDLFAAGVISNDDFVRLKDFEYQPLELLKDLDPIQEIEVPGSKPLTVTSSGIAPLGDKAIKLLQTNSQLLLANVIARTQGRIAKNKANEVLLRLATNMPNNGIVYAKPPKGVDTTRLGVFINGVEKDLWMDTDLVAQWAQSTPAINRQYATIASVASGANLVRAFATGINPEFALRNFPRDILFSWFTTNEFSSFIPLAAAQYGVDFTTVISDALLRKGRFNDYIREGGGMNFLTHGAVYEAGASRLGAGRAFKSKWDKVLSVLGYINESSELVTRLALRERAIRNRMTKAGLRYGEDAIPPRISEHATWVARNYLDFSQGGNVTKHLDLAIPYLNVATLVLRNSLTAVKKDPVRIAGKIANLGAVASSIWAYNRFMYPEAFDDIPADIKARNWIFMTPYSYLDKQGNKRQLYVRVPVDGIVMPAKTAFESLLAREVDGEIPSDEIIESFKNAFTFITEPALQIPPIFRAITEYLADYSFWSNRPMWGEPDDIPPRFEVKGRESEVPTSRLAEDIGQMLGASPERLGTVIHDILPRNIYSSEIPRTIYSGLQGELPREWTDVSGLKLIQRLPFVQSMTSTTYPAGKELEELEEATEEITGEQFERGKEIDGFISDFWNAETREEKREIKADMMRFIKEQEPSERQRLMDRQLDLMKINKTFREGDPSGLPARGWWIKLRGLPAEQRAVAFWDQYVQRPPRCRRKMMAFVGKINGISSQDFGRELNKIKQNEFGRLEREIDPKITCN